MAKLTASTEELTQLTNELNQITILKELVIEAAKQVELDEKQLNNRLKATEGYQFGETIGLMNLFGKIMEWPSFNDADNSLIPDRQVTLNKWFESKFGYAFNSTLFNRFKKARGYTAFVTDDHEAIDAKEPDWEVLTPILVTMADHLGIEIYDAELSESKWKAAAVKAANNVAKSIKETDAALAEHKAMMAAIA